jgi:hypothetical protein
MSLAQIHAEDRRLIILRSLDESGYHANETVLKQVTEQFGHAPSRDLIRSDLLYLTEHSLVRCPRTAGRFGSRIC